LFAHWRFNKNRVALADIQKIYLVFLSFTLWTVCSLKKLKCQRLVIKNAAAIKIRMAMVFLFSNILSNYKAPIKLLVFGYCDLF